MNLFNKKKEVPKEILNPYAFITGIERIVNACFYDMTFTDWMYILEHYRPAERRHGIMFFRKRNGPDAGMEFDEGYMKALCSIKFNG